VKFYEFLGMKVVRKLEFPEAKFDLYFLGYDAPGALYHGKHTMGREGLIEVSDFEENKMAQLVTVLV
jgi:lactoylglutathione lyase